jgi:hypothetical protein
MVKNRVYVVLLIVLVIFLIVMFMLFGTKTIKEEKISEILVVGDETVWKYSNKKWHNLTYKSTLQDLSWKKYRVFENNKDIGNYYLWYSDKWYVFDNDKNPIEIDGNLLAVRSNYDIPVYNFDIEKITDYTYALKVLKEKEINDKNYTVSSKVEFDFDNDGDEEEFYLVSNVFPTGFSPEKIFSIVFMVKNEEIYPIYTDISENTGFNGCKPYFNAFLDIDDDKKSELILSCGRYSVSTPINMLYKYEDNEFKIIISNNK